MARMNSAVVLLACALAASAGPFAQALHVHHHQTGKAPTAPGLALRGGSAPGEFGAPGTPRAGTPARQDSSDISGRDVSGLTGSMSLERLGNSASISQLELGAFGMRRVPKTMELLQFMVPTFGIFLANPVLSLVDTAAVGQFCNKEALAALGPGTALCDMVTYLANFLAVATTTLLASAIARKETAVDDRDAPDLREAPDPFFTGGSADAEATMEMSMAYVHIRGIASIPTLLSLVAQAACIGAKDSVSPMKAVGLVAVFNIFLDWLFVGPLKKGVAGAAFATAIAQIVGAIYLFSAVANIVNKLEESEYDGGNILLGEEDEAKTRSKTLFAVPSKEECIKFSQFAGPLFLISCGRGFTWNIMTPAAGACGLVPLAAHQVLINVFFFFTIAGESIFQTAQAFLPELQEDQARSKAEGGAVYQEASAKVIKLVKKVLAIAVGIGILQIALCMIPSYVFPQMFTADTEVQAAVREQATLLSMSIFPHCVTVAVEAILLNTKDLDFLGAAHICRCIIFAGYLRYSVKHRPVLRSMWVGMCVMQYMGVAIWVGRILTSGKKLGIPLLRKRTMRMKQLQLEGKLVRSKPREASGIAPGGGEGTVHAD
eukprot:CAMPEP_0180332300 /NCGR_PEP_ID=MMETSP0988-20121125/42446_1 /TAXON_ID=697907 /ORGANISM="non described non described, Strain CCMP2293" /LENGTH=602 /DNA_ID=CAMNT_0022319911 /DNA_START=154 /DNA_END=1961 /DNA_ORIENTATION=-